MHVQLVPSFAGQPSDVCASLYTALTSSPSPTLFRTGIAYATLGGTQHLLHRLSATSSWEAIAKQFLVGVHHAISEPSAITALAAAPNAEVRVFIPKRRLDAQAFDDDPTFHPKVFAVSGPNPSSPLLVQAGSHNLTRSAMAMTPKNHEFGVAVLGVGADAKRCTRSFDAWWKPLWNTSRPADTKLIAQYSKLRKQLLDANPILQSAIEAPPSIQYATEFFIEVGAGSGPPGRRHQVEFPEQLALYFGELIHGRHNLTLHSEGNSWPNRPLSYKQTTYGVDIWRLGMPTQFSGGVPIANRVIKFTRRGDSSFDFQVVDPTDQAVARWAELANQRGHLGSTRGQRQRRYGFY